MGKVIHIMDMDQIYLLNAINQKEIKLFVKEELRDHIYINDLAKVCVSLILKKNMVFLI